MGTTASAAQQMVSVAPPCEIVHGNGMADSRRSLSVNSFQTVNIHNNKAKSIITNKVAPVVITYNCREEFQIHDDILKANYTVGRISDNMPEHYLVQEIIFFCIREEPILFLHSENDFVPYTPRRKENLHENLHSLGKDVKVENLEITIRKELNENVYYVYKDIEHFKDEPQRVTISCEEDIHVTEEVFKRPVFTMPSYRYLRLPLPMEGAPLEEHFDTFINTLRESPSLLHCRDNSRPLPALLFSCQVGVGRTNLGMILGTLVMYQVKGAPEAAKLSEGTCLSQKCQFQIIRNFISAIPNGVQIIDEVNTAIAECSEMHDIKEAINENKKKLKGIGEDYKIQCTLFDLQVSHDHWAPDILSTVKEMRAANFRRVPKMPIYGMAQPNSEAVGFVLGYLTEKRKHAHVLWVNLQDELVLEGNGQVYIPWEPSCIEHQILVPATSPEQIEELETAVKEEIIKSQKWLEVSSEQKKQMKMFKTCLTVQEIFGQHKNSYPGLTYRRIPIPDNCAPREQDFDRLMEAMKTILADDSHAAFVFNCHNGKGRTTTALVIAALTLWHFNGFPELTDDEIVSVPDAKYTKGEFEVVMKLVRILPEGLRMKKEVDTALDAVSETMTPMHYHLREIIICTYRQIKTAKCDKERQILQLQSLQYLERYIFLILFNTYLHLEKKDSWQRPFSIWMNEVAARAGVYDILNQLGFVEFENPEDTALARLRYRWRQQHVHSLPFQGELI
ncbi:PALD protein, partial [Polypterus senegalus]